MVTRVKNYNCKEQVFLNWLQNHNLYKSVLQGLPDELTDKILDQNFSFRMDYVDAPVYEERYVKDKLGHRTRVLECAYYPNPPRKKYRTERYDNKDDPTEPIYGFCEDLE